MATSRSALAALALAIALGGCSADIASFSVTDLNPLKGEDPLRQSDYNYFYKRDHRDTGVVTAADLVSPDGRCAFAPAPVPSQPDYAPPVAAAPPPAPTAQAAEPAPVSSKSDQALYFTAGPEANPGAARGGNALPPEVRNGPAGIALAMTECQVVGTAGYTDRVEIGANQRGEREVTLTYLAGPHPGIYRFRSGRLISMERTAEPVQPKPQRAKATKTAKKQPAR